MCAGVKLFLQMKETEHGGAESTLLRGGGAHQFGSRVSGPEDVGPEMATNVNKYVKQPGR